MDVESMTSFLLSGWGLLIIAIAVITLLALIAAARERLEARRLLSELGADPESLRAAPRAIEPEPSAEPEIEPVKEETTEIPRVETPVEGTVMIEWRGSLVAVSGVLAGKRFPVTEEGFHVGRDEDLSEVVIDDSRVSRRHVWIGLEGDRVVVQDQKSTNGTKLNGIEVTKAALEDGDLVTVGDDVVTFRFET